MRRKDDKGSRREEWRKKENKEESFQIVFVILLT